MSKHLLEMLKDKGYERYSCSITFPKQNLEVKNHNKKILSDKEKYSVVFVEGNETEGKFYYKDKFRDFSTMRPDGIDYRYVKDLDFENEIVWGLNELGKPPTLKYPRPNVVRKKTINGISHTQNGVNDNEINDLLSRYPHEKILEAILSQKEILVYNDDKIEL